MTETPKPNLSAEALTVYNELIRHGVDTDLVPIKLDGKFSAVEDILRERAGQDAKFGEQNHSFADWLIILTEEIGEACQDAQELRSCVRSDSFPSALGKNFRKELVQVAAVAMAILECGDRNNWF